MKGKLKQTKGITLIALIITIIVLLILAIVSIRLVMNDGIIGKSEKAVKAYSESETEEKVKLAYADYQMGKLTDSSYTFETALQNGKVAYTSVTGSDAEGYIVTATISDGRTKQFNVTSTGVSKIKDLEDYGLKVGDYVAYNEAGFGDYTTDTSKGIGGSILKWDSATKKLLLNEKTYTTENLGWRVLGVNDKGELELISDIPTTEQLHIANKEGYLYGPDELNTMCNKLYGNGTGSTGKVVATGARSLKRDDIDRLLGITTENQRKEQYGGIGYGLLLQYKYLETDSHLQYRTSSDDGVSWTDWEDSFYDYCELPSGFILSSSKKGISEVVRVTYYCAAYWLLDGDIKEMIGCDKLNNQNTWLATNYVDNNGSEIVYGLVCSHSNGQTYSVSQGGTYSNAYMRPVVTISSDVQIDTTSTDGKSAETAYEIK